MSAPAGTHDPGAGPEPVRSATGLSLMKPVADLFPSGDDRASSAAVSYPQSENASSLFGKLLQQYRHWHKYCDSGCKKCSLLGIRKMQRKIMQNMVVQGSSQSGFTLFEIGLAVAIVCLLATVTLMGQDYTINSQVNRLERDFRSIQNAVYDLQDGVRSRHGDIHKASLNLQDAAVSGNNLNMVQDGNWTSTSGETFKIWRYVRPAALAQSSWAENKQAQAPIKLPGGILGVSETDSTLITGLAGKYTICTTNIAGRLVKKLDLVMDDGNTASGSMRASNLIGGAAVTSDNISNSATYMVCLGV
jgi:type II secretory pathway pseudopilin PulG